MDEAWLWQILKPRKFRPTESWCLELWESPTLFLLKILYKAWYQHAQESSFFKYRGLLLIFSSVYVQNIFCYKSLLAYCGLCTHHHEVNSVENLIKSAFWEDVSSHAVNFWQDFLCNQRHSQEFWKILKQKSCVYVRMLHWMEQQFKAVLDLPGHGTYILFNLWNQYILWKVQLFYKSLD